MTINPLRIYQRHKARKARKEALDLLGKAKRRKDTRSIHYATKRLKSATHECLRVGA